MSLGALETILKNFKYVDTGVNSDKLRCKTGRTDFNYLMAEEKSKLSDFHPLAVDSAS